MNPTDTRSLFSLVVLILLYLSLLVTSVQSAPGSQGPQDRAFIAFDDKEQFPFLRNYEDFQISDGVGGSAEEEAAMVFLRPFDGIDLATVPYELFDKLKLAKEVSEDAEIEWFEPAIARAGEDDPTGQALKVGLHKNRVLFATAALQVLEIEAAHNKALNVVDPYEEEDLTFATEYLAWTIEHDRENDGEPSLGVT